MKKILLALVVLLVLGFAFLAVSGRKMQVVKTEIEISAPPATVWNIVTDIENWQEWSPTINGSEGKASVGSAVTITMMSKEAGKDGPKYSPTIIKMDEPNYFHWRAHMMAGFIFTNEKIIELEETEAGTRLTHTETFKGLLTPLMRGHMDKGVPPMLNIMNEALKQKAES